MLCAGDTPLFCNMSFYNMSYCQVYRREICDFCAKEKRIKSFENPLTKGIKNGIILKLSLNAGVVQW